MTLAGGFPRLTLRYGRPPRLTDRLSSRLSPPIQGALVENMVVCAVELAAYSSWILISTTLLVPPLQPTPLNATDILRPFPNQPSRIIRQPPILPRLLIPRLNSPE